MNSKTEPHVLYWATLQNNGIVKNLKLLLKGSVTHSQQEAVETPGERSMFQEQRPSLKWKVLADVREKVLMMNLRFYLPEEKFTTNHSCSNQN